jgi:dTDP-4-dehydrorhamnose reductase
MRILITGSNGLLGQKLVRHLEAHPEFHGIATSRGSRKFSIKTSNIHYESMDILQFSQVKSIFEKHHPDVVIHTAAMTQADQCEKNKELAFQVNVGAVKKLVEYCNQLQIHLIQLSTDFVFDGTSGPYDEEDMPNPINYYGTTKYLSEQIVLDAKCPSTVIRTILVYGSTENLSRSNFLLWVKTKLEKAEHIQVVNDQIRNPTLVEDLVIGCMLILINKKTGIYHIGGDETLNPFHFAKRISVFFNLDSTLITPVHADIFKEVARRPLITGLKIGKAVNELAYHPHTLLEGLNLVSQQLNRNQLQ